MIDRQHNSMERLGAGAAYMLLLLLAFNVVAPYLSAWLNVKVPTELMRLVDQNQQTIQNLALMLFSFLFGASVGSRMKDTTISAMVESAKALPTGSTGVDVAMQPGDTVKVEKAATPGDPPA